VSVRDNLAEVRRRLEAASRAAARDPASVRLIAVSKEQPVELAFEAHDLGVEDFGENTAHGLAEKAEAFARAGRKARFHFIGHLQRNKINSILPHVHVIHSVDRPELSLALSKRAGDRVLDVLVQVNIGRELQKGGIAPEGAVAFSRDVASLPGLRLLGLMGIPPADVDPTPFFVELAGLSQALQGTPEGRAARELSMGMTQDFESAIRHGATMVRVGTAIFGGRAAHGVQR
jgi:pyridoxal phosphate enzyme (YggS family)